MIMIKKKKQETQRQLQIDGSKVTLEVGRLAYQANASITLNCGGTTLLATVVCSSPREDLDYFPLHVEYVERLYAGGRIKGSRWVKREGRPSDEAVLTARLVDRAIRPLFPAGFKHEVQVVITVLSVDLENDPSVLALLAASAALHLSDIPWQGPVGVVRVGLKDKVYFANPIEERKESSELDLVVATSKDGVVMIEAGANQVPDDQFLAGVEFGFKEGNKIIEFLEEMRKDFGKEKIKFAPFLPDAELLEKVDREIGDKVAKLVDQLVSKEAKKEEVGEIFDQVSDLAEEAKLALGDEVRGLMVREAVNKVFKKRLRKEILAGRRPGKRGEDVVRSIGIEVGVLPRTHGSAIFQRGETQALTVATLGAPSLKQLIESAEGEEVKRYMHHYFMPPYATGQTGRMMGPGRREIGHGALAEKALLPVIPSEEKFPYAIRLVSEIMSSNGSTSMASTCGSTLSLMDAGVPITAPVAGISIGLVKEGTKSVVLTDIAGIEDFNGDMDFKVAGTRTGITAVQLDMKIAGIDLALVKEVLARANKTRQFLLDEIEKVLPQPRAKVSQYAPKIKMIKIAEDKIGELIGPGGKTIRQIIEETTCDINVDNDGMVSITGLTEESISTALEKVDALTRQVKVGEVFSGTVKRIQPFGAFVEFLPGKDGLIHVSRLSTGYINNPEQVVKLGQSLEVRVREVDEMGRINLEPTTPLPAPSGSTRPPSGPRQENNSYRHKGRESGRDRGKPQFKNRFVTSFANSDKKS